jgi:hypothetical protein
MTDHLMPFLLAKMPKPPPQQTPLSETARLLGSTSLKR